jgi:hypothetical protein
MFDFTSNLVPLSPDSDDLPLPERIAAQYGFQLAAYDDPETGKRYYAVRDWIAGVAKAPDPGDFWKKMRKRFAHLLSFCKPLPYRANNGRMLQVDHSPTEGLFEIVQRMGTETGIARCILEGTSPKELSLGGIYLFSIKEMPGYYKVGASKAVQRRLAGYNTAMPFTVILEFFVEHPNYRLVERLLHRKFKNKRIKGEWFTLSNDDVAQIKHILLDGMI